LSRQGLIYLCVGQTIQQAVAAGKVFSYKPETSEAPRPKGGASRLLRYLPFHPRYPERFFGTGLSRQGYRSKGHGFIARNYGHYLATLTFIFSFSGFCQPDIPGWYGKRPF